MNLVFFDLETQNLLQDVGGRAGIERLRLSCGVTFSTERNDFAVYWERDAQALIQELKNADRVIGFNLIGFDYPVLRPYAPGFNFWMRSPTHRLVDGLGAHGDSGSWYGSGSSRWRASRRPRCDPRSCGWNFGGSFTHLCKCPVRSSVLAGGWSIAC